MLKLSADEKFSEPCALLLGGFDGLHLGHRALLAAAKRSGLPVGITSLFGGKGKELFTRAERETVFALNGVDFVLGFPFTREFQATSAADFLHVLFSRLAVRLVVCGEDFRFGKDAAGTPTLLKELAPCPVTVVRAVARLAEDGKLRKISASDCKELLKRGDLAALNACLCPREEDFFGGAYFIQGTVEHGRQVGRTYGFPTLNLRTAEEKLLPPDGVYGGLCATPKGNFPCIVNLGARPTFGVEERKIEAYLDGFSGDLYGQTVRVFPTEFFRGIKKFGSAEALKEQLSRDILRLRGHKG